MFSEASTKNLAECHPYLQELLQAAERVIDCTIIDGKRTDAEQAKNVAKGVSKTLDSLHLPRDAKTGTKTDSPDGVSFAVDALPYPVDWSKLQRGLDAVKAVDPELQILRAYFFQGVVRGLAESKGYRIRQGIDFDSDTKLGNQSFIDLPHIEVKLP